MAEIDDKALVSVIIPTYNRAGILPLAINSALSQSYANVQIIVVDDGSEDNTAEIIKAFPTVEYYVKEHGGQAAARNFGLSKARGTFIATLDSDDIWSPEFLAKCVAKMEAGDLDLVFANWLQNYIYGDTTDYLTGDPNVKRYIKPTPDRWIDLTYAEARHLFLLCCPSPSSSLMIRKSSIVTEWNENILIGDDWCMCLDIILSKERKIAFTIEPLWEKRIDSQNIFDGRTRHEVLRFLYIQDLETMTDRFKEKLSKEELFTFRMLYMAALVELSKHEIIRGFNLKEAMRLLKKSFAADVGYTLKMIPFTLRESMRKKWMAIKKP